MRRIGAMEEKLADTLVSRRTLSIAGRNGGTCVTYEHWKMPHINHDM